MKPIRGPKHTPPPPGGESFEVEDVGPPTYHYPMPPAKSFGKLIGCDEWEVEEVRLTPVVPASPVPGLRITVTRQPEPVPPEAVAEQQAGNAATIAALETLLRQYAAAGYRVQFELTAGRVG